MGKLHLRHELCNVCEAVVFEDVSTKICECCGRFEILDDIEYCKRCDDPCCSRCTVMEGLCKDCVVEEWREFKKRIV